MAQILKSAEVHTERYSPNWDGRYYGPNRSRPARRLSRLQRTKPEDGQYCTGNSTWRIKAVLSIVAILIVLISGTAYSMTPKIAAPQKPFVYVPDTMPTGAPGARPHLDKTSLIIQQDVNCWLGGLPGATCDPATRTYL